MQAEAVTTPSSDLKRPQHNEYKRLFIRVLINVSFRAFISLFSKCYKTLFCLSFFLFLRIQSGCFVLLRVLSAVFMPLYTGFCTFQYLFMHGILFNCDFLYVLIPLSVSSMRIANGSASAIWLRLLSIRSKACSRLLSSCCLFLIA